MKEVTTYEEFVAGQSLSTKMRVLARKSAIMALSRGKSINSTSNSIRFPYYHHVFQDERSGFERQMKFLKNNGECISLDQACDMLEGKIPIDGKYYCVSFDDGFRNNFTHMREIVETLEVPTIIYLATDFIGLDVSIEEDAIKVMSFNDYNGEKSPLVAFLSWEECREMQSDIISFGSHTCSHAHLIKLGNQQLTSELIKSKEKIESELGKPCLHFACPWGREIIDFDPKVAPEIAEEIGYRSFGTTNRGKMEAGGNPYLIKRDHLLANWEDYQLKYFLGD